MPKYDYFCEENGMTIEVNHDTDTKLKTWGEVCFVAQISLGDTDALTPVRPVSYTHLTLPTNREV